MTLSAKRCCWDIGAGEGQRPKVVRSRFLALYFFLDFEKPVLCLSRGSVCESLEGWRVTLSPPQWEITLWHQALYFSVTKLIQCNQTANCHEENKHLSVWIRYIWKRPFNYRQFGERPTPPVTSSAPAAGENWWCSACPPLAVSRHCEGEQPASVVLVTSALAKATSPKSEQGQEHGGLW